MKPFLRYRTRTVSPAAESPSSKPASRSSSFSKTRRQAADGSKKPRASTEKASTSATTNSKNKRRSKFYNKTCVEKPTELFRTDLISQMTVTDNEPLNSQYDLIQLTDTWRRDWNAGVQVPVHGGKDDLIENGRLDNSSDGLKILKEEKSDFTEATRPPAPVFYEVDDANSDESTGNSSGTSPRSLRSKDRQAESDPSTSKGADDQVSKIGRHQIQVELDDLDLRWLDLVNSKLHKVVFPRFTLNEDQLEKSIERMEIAYALRCADEQQSASFLKQQSDSDAVCDVCRGEFSEDGNLLVFCDRCNVCVHQACYGIRRVPSGPWVCRPCTQDVHPACILCPNRGGAMKSTKSGTRWAHVSCAVWIPEVAFGNPTLKEPVTRIARIPEERWTLQCEICDQRSGACVQCNVRNCHVSYHVTCAQRAGWKVTYKDLGPDDDPNDVLESFCKKHSKNWPSAMEDDESRDGVWIEAVDRRQQATSQLGYKILIGMKYSDLEHVFDRMHEVPVTFRRAIFYYWRTKRLSAPERNLVFDIDECQMAVERDREAEFICRRVDSLISLRQTLEKTRTMCYMVERREKIKRQWINSVGQQFELLSALDEAPGGRQSMDMAKFLKEFSLGGQSSDWLPKSEKMETLFTMFPPTTIVTQAPVTSTPVPRKRGRPPTKSVMRSGTHSPLATLNRPTPKKSSQKRKLSEEEYEDRSGKVEEEGKSDETEDGSFAQQSKRKRMPRVQYSPT